MSNKNKKIAMWGFYVLIGVLLGFAASRTFHFVSNVMDNAIQGYMFLFATGLGALIWLYVYLNYAEGSSQRAIAFVMGIVDLCGELILTYADMQYVGDKAGLVKMTENEMQIFFAVSVLVVGLNIFAGYIFKLSDLHAQQEQHAQDLVDHVTDETMKHLNTPEAKSQMVQELLPILKASISARVQAEIFSRASQTAGLDARAVGWPLRNETEKKEVTVPLVLGLGEKNTNGTWMQAITKKDGSRVRAFCLMCMKEGKSWIGGELCEHFDQVETVGPSGKLDQPLESADQK